ncbi:type 1 glutamine amidotransferase [Amycolatopsis thermophila]|uniref:GMP synthase-like glutamine amidotransferase n=1 Tax=Amycolatopsis thermophila TaxID=206084 RepID=A0ABU0EPB7_9PSEU|nr:type 1 glutamine amidotransferase [Amycolatopsis thermophila]MDQ0377134.1 GMP synthase-like glutamine amidotransferase [Amycolatopsis thermophila]
MTTRLLVLQPDPTDPVGPLGDWLTGAGAELDLRRLPDDPIPATLDGYQGLVCLGGGMSAADDAIHPWLADVRAVLATAARTNVPTLAICLGAQLLADATGGRVERGADGPEVGAALVAKKDAAWSDPLFADLPLMQDVMHFHTDVITRLPNGAVLLASNPKYANQAFRLHRSAYGIQFHIETTTQVVQAWADEAPDIAATRPPRVFDTETLDRNHADIEETWRPFVTRFVRLADGALESAPPPSLPLT